MVDVPQGNLVLSTTASTRVVDYPRSPAQGNLILSATVLQIARTYHQNLTPARGNLILSATAPKVSNVPWPGRVVLSTLSGDRDRHIRRSGADYASATLALLPQGQAWPRSADSVLVKTIRGLAEYWGRVDGRAADLLEQESDARRTIELLVDWERNWGLPDPCYGDALTIGERQALLVFKMTLLGGQSRAWFQYVSTWNGQPEVTIGEFAPFMAGVSQAGETRELDSDGELVGNYRWYIGPPEMRFYWTAHLGQLSYTWFRASSGQAGVDPHLRIGTPLDTDCLLRRWKPAHTELVFDFSQMGEVGPLYGTP